MSIKNSYTVVTKKPNTAVTNKPNTAVKKAKYCLKKTGAVIKKDKIKAIRLRCCGALRFLRR